MEARGEEGGERMTKRERERGGKKEEYNERREIIRKLLNSGKDRSE